MEEKYYYVYKITFLCGEYKEHYYIGAHYGNMFDDYCGSGAICEEYYKKYGKLDTYKKEIICICTCQEHASRLEKELIASNIDNELCENRFVIGHTGCHKKGTGIKYVHRKYPGHPAWNKGKHFKIIDGKHIYY